MGWGVQCTRCPARCSGYWAMTGIHEIFILINYSLMMGWWLVAACVWDQRPADMQPSDVRFEDVVQYNILERKPYSTTLKVPTREDLGDKHCVLKSAISKYVHPVKHRFHVWQPATRTRHLHPSLVLYQPGSLMSSHVFSCLANCSQVPMLTSYWVPAVPHAISV